MSLKSDYGQMAFDAGKSWERKSHESGVANARVVTYGFSKWFNSWAPVGGITKGFLSGSGVTKAYLLKSFREGYAAGKRVASRSNPRGVSLASIDAALRKAGKTVKVTLTGAGAAAVKKALSMTPGGRRKARSEQAIRRVMGNPLPRPNVKYTFSSSAGAKMALAKLKRYYRHTFKGSKVAPTPNGWGIMLKNVGHTGLTLGQIPAIFRQWGMS